MNHQIGDLVHIPQAVSLIDCDFETDAQMTIPLRVWETSHPKIGVVTYVTKEGYVRVYCDGAQWAVKNQSVYKLVK